VDDLVTFKAVVPCQNNIILKNLVFYFNVEKRLK